MVLEGVIVLTGNVKCLDLEEDQAEDEPPQWHRECPVHVWSCPVSAPESRSGAACLNHETERSGL